MINAKNSIKISITLAGTLSLGMVAAAVWAAGNNSQALMGKWIRVEGNVAFFPSEIDLFENGAGVHVTSGGRIVPITWQAGKGELSWACRNDTIPKHIVQYKVVGDTLTLMYDIMEGGWEATYKIFIRADVGSMDPPNRLELSLNNMEPINTMFNLATKFRYPAILQDLCLSFSLSKGMIDTLVCPLTGRPYMLVDWSSKEDDRQGEHRLRFLGDVVVAHSAPHSSGRIVLMNDGNPTPPTGVPGSYEQETPWRLRTKLVPEPEFAQIMADTGALINEWRDDEVALIFSDENGQNVLLGNGTMKKVNKEEFERLHKSEALEKMMHSYRFRWQDED